MLKRTQQAFSTCSENKAVTARCAELIGKMSATFDLKTLAGRSMRQSPHRVAVIRTKINQTEAVCTAGAVKIASSMR